MTAEVRLRISAGRGPREARRFVGLLADALGRRFVGAVVGEIRCGEADAPGRVVLRVATDRPASLATVTGTHLLLAELRGPKARRRWFAEVEQDAPGLAPVELSPGDLEVRFVRARGPGGQNVNKRATAVQLTHRPTGITVSCDRHRSQARNRAGALESLRDALHRHLHETYEAQRKTQTWQSRRALLTRTPVMQWRLNRAGLLVPA